MIDVLLAAEIDGDKLAFADVVSNAMLLVQAGLETTASAMSFAFHYLGTHPDERGNSTSVPSAPADAGKGAEISELATTTDLTGVEKGAAISTAASGGKSQAGQRGSASGAGAVETPNSGGTGTADTASGGKSVTGPATANTASGGKSAAGSGNASNGQETADTASGGRL